MTSSLIITYYIFVTLRFVCVCVCLCVVCVRLCECALVTTDYSLYSIVGFFPPRFVSRQTSTASPNDECFARGRPHRRVEFFIRFHPDRTPRKYPAYPNYRAPVRHSIGTVSPTRLGSQDDLLPARLRGAQKRRPFADVDHRSGLRGTVSLAFFRAFPAPHPLPLFATTVEHFPQSRIFAF